MSKDTETQFQATNSYTSIAQLSGPSKTACAKCDANKLPFCICSKSGSGENKDTEESSATTEEKKEISSMQPNSHFSAPFLSYFEGKNNENPVLILFVSQKEFQFTLKPNAKLTDIKALLEQFIIELTHNVDDEADIKELGKNLGIYYDDTRGNILTITIQDPKHFVEFFSRLRADALIVIKQDQAQEIGSITCEEDCQSFKPTPYKMTLTPF